MSAAASPWKPLGVAPQPASLSEIMSEELAENLQREEEAKISKLLYPELSEEDGGIPEDECEEDFLLAQMLQHEFNQEHDHLLRLEEAKFNGNNKVAVSFANFRSLHPADEDEEEDGAGMDDDARERSNNLLDVVEEPRFGPGGFVVLDGAVLTKHDPELCGRKNTSRVLEFPPHFKTGDAAGIDLRLSNKVFNALKLHSMSESKRRNRVHEKKEKSTAEMAVDADTRLILYKMVNGGLLDGLTGTVATGKEAVVFHAFGGTVEGQEIPTECAVKVYKTTLNEFKNRADYVKDDYRFKNVRKIVRLWAEKEMMNLNRMRRCGLPCPEVVKLKKNVLVMSFLGEDTLAAPRLKEAQLAGEELQAAYAQCCDIVKKLYQECCLVHADLSEFNILYWKGTCYVIDVSQAVDLSHSQSLPLLARDCANLTEFFARNGAEVTSTRELFNEVTGLKMESDETFLADVNSFADENRSVDLRHDKHRPADCLARRGAESGGDEEEEFN